MKTHRDHGHIDEVAALFTIFHMSLEIYVDAGCSTCDQARWLAGEVARQYPQVSVDLVDISETERELPEAVFAVPTYILDGAVISLGNPSYEELSQKLQVESVGGS